MLTYVYKNIQMFVCRERLFKILFLWKCFALKINDASWKNTNIIITFIPKDLQQNELHIFYLLFTIMHFNFHTKFAFAQNIYMPFYKLHFTPPTLM